MRNIKQYATMALAALLIAACGGEQSAEEKQAQVQEYRTQIAELEAKVAELESELDGPAEVDKNGEVLVASMPLKRQPFFHQIEVRGSVESRKNVMISAETMGRIERIMVREGDQVRKGQLLAEMDADILRNNISEVETSLELAQAIFKRQENLWKQNIGTEVQFLQAKNNKESLERRLATLKSQLRQYRITAPFDGSVDDVPVRVGEMAQPGVPLMRIVNPRDMYIKADVSEAYLGKFRADDKVSVYFPITDRRFTSTISSVSKVINSENRTFVAEVSLPPASGFEYQPNQVVVLKMTDYANDSAISVPTRLIQTDSEGKYVFVIGENGNKRVAKKARVKTGLTYNSRTEILEGLKEDELMIDQGYRDVTHGVEIKLAAANY